MLSVGSLDRLLSEGACLLLPLWEERAKALGPRRTQQKTLSRYWMTAFLLPRVKHKTIRRTRSAIKRITQDRVACVREMHAYLMSSSSAKLYEKQRSVMRVLNRAHLGEGRFS